MRYKVLVERSLDQMDQLVRSVKSGMEGKNISAEDTYNTIKRIETILADVREKINLEDER